MYKIITKYKGGGNLRLSNFEALRLLCMLMVLNLHSFSGYSHGNGIWQALDFFRESTSICAVDCFLLISGYFGIKWKFKSLFNLVFQLFYYSVGIYLAVVGMGIVNWNIKDFMMRFACLFTDSWKFAITYVLLWFCAPPLNALAEKLSSRDLFLYIIVFFLVINFISIPQHALFTYALVYLIGRLLKKISVEKSRIPAGKAYLITTFFIFALTYFLVFKTLQITSAVRFTSWPIGFLAFDYAAPLVILQAIFLFIFFARLTFQSKFINWCAASCFAIFLIHMHPSIKFIGYYGFTTSLYELPVTQHVLILIVLIVGVFCGSILIDKLRIAISNITYSVLERVNILLPAKWYKIETYMPRLTTIITD